MYLVTVTHNIYFFSFYFEALCLCCQNISDFVLQTIQDQLQFLALNSSVLVDKQDFWGDINQILYQGC